tara:strand:- start:5842 stop:6945 length:1104 start_codon:yes stop_codon:yes gene_type:complete
MKLSKHTIIFDYESGIFLLYNVLTRKGVLIEKCFFNENLTEKSSNGYLFKDVSTFSLSKTLVDNPNGLLNNLLNYEIKKVSREKIIDICKSKSIFSEDESYIKSVGLKTSFFDNKHLGNFHQQIGEYVLKTFKKNSEDWWIYQKFNKSLDKTLDNAYSWVQEVFLKSYFNNSMMKNKKVLDFGCGVGYYSNYFAPLASSVDSVDPSEHYISLAKKKFNTHENLNFFVAKFETDSDFKSIGQKYDYIFLIDVFLYFFVPYKSLSLSPAELLKQLKSKLYKNGKIFIIDPHGSFHLQPWFNKQTPFLISTEYATKKYRVTPTLEEMSKAIEESGLTISKIRELKYNGNDSDKKFYKEFPFWWFFELSNN